MFEISRRFWFQKNIQAVSVISLAGLEKALGVGRHTSNADIAKSVEWHKVNYIDQPHNIPRLGSVLLVTYLVQFCTLNGFPGVELVQTPEPGKLE